MFREESVTVSVLEMSEIKRLISGAHARFLSSLRIHLELPVYSILPILQNISSVSRNKPVPDVLLLGDVHRFQEPRENREGRL